MFPFAFCFCLVLFGVWVVGVCFLLCPCFFFLGFGRKCSVARS